MDGSIRRARSRRPPGPVLFPSGSRGAGATAALASFSFSPRSPHTAWHSLSRVGSVRIFSGQKEEGEKETWWWFPRTVPNTCLSMAEAVAALLVPLASALPPSVSRWGAAYPCTGRAVSSGPGRRVVAYFLSGTMARASLEKGNGMCWSDVVKDTGHLREIKHLRGLICSGNLSQVCWRTDLLLLPPEPPSSGVMPLKPPELFQVHRSGERACWG